MPSASSGQLCEACAAAGLPALKAAAEGHAKCLSKAFSTDRQRSLACDSKGATALHLAARGGRLDCVKWLLAKSGIPGTVKAKNGETPLHLSAAAGHIGCLQYLVSHDKKAANIGDHYGQTPLHLAVLRERSQCSKWLLEIAKADPLATTKTGAVPLHFAAAQGSLKIARLLLGNMPEGSVDIHDKEGTTALYYAAQSGNLPVVCELVNCYHANTLATSNDGMTALHAAAQSGQLEVLQWLYSFHSGKHMMDRASDGATVLHFAASTGKMECLIWLLSLDECGFTGVDCVDTSGSSPAHDAAENGELECLQVLVSHGADVTLKDNEGYSAYDLAFHGEHDECAAFLKAEESRKYESTLTRHTPVRAKYHQKRILNGEVKKASQLTGSRYRDKQLFNPTYSASSLMKALPDRMSSASSLPMDVAEMASLDDDLVDTDSDDTPGSSMQNISSAHMLPALKEQLEAMGVLAADLQVHHVQSGLPPLASSGAVSTSSRSLSTVGSGSGSSGGGNSYNSVMRTSVSMEALAFGETVAACNVEFDDSDPDTRSLSEELHRSTVSLTTERVDPRYVSDSHLTASVEEAEQHDEVQLSRSHSGHGGMSHASPTTGAADRVDGGSDARTAPATVTHTPSERSAQRPLKLVVEEDDEATPKVSPTTSPTAHLSPVDEDLPLASPQSESSGHSVLRGDSTPQGSPRLKRTSSAVSNRLKFISGVRPITPCPDDVIVFKYDDEGIPIPPPAPTAESLMVGVVSLQTVAADKVPQWMRRYRRGWLAKAMGDSIRPEEELMFVLGLRKRQVDKFENLIALKAAQIASSSRPQSPEKPDKVEEERPETPPLESSFI